MLNQIKNDAFEWLKKLIAIPSLSKSEDQTADFLQGQLKLLGYPVNRIGHNLWLASTNWQLGLPTILLCSHHDTVKPGDGWHFDPYAPVIKNDCIYGLGSNDAGGSLMALLAAFRYFNEIEKLPTANLLFAAVAEEEISGANGITAVLPKLPGFEFAIIGEPTNMQMAIAEKGLVVIDGYAKGKTGHAARNEGVNALYKAIDDIHLIRDHQFAEVSPLLGPVKCTVTQIEAGYQHNVVPDHCHYVIDVRTNECYTNQEVLDQLQSLTSADLVARSTRLNSSGISMDHPLVKSGLRLGLTTFGSPTLSDQALINGPTLKIGCGDSARSHTPNEYLAINELFQGIDLYIQLLKGI